MLARNLCIALNIVVGLMISLSLLFQMTDDRIEARLQTEGMTNTEALVWSNTVFAATLVLLAAPAISLMVMLRSAGLWAKITATLLHLILLLIAAAILARTVYITPWLDPTNHDFPLLPFIICGMFMATSAGSMVQVWKQPTPQRTEAARATK